MDILKQLRKQNGFTQKEVAKELGITVSAYGNYELGQRQPTPEMLCKLADMFEVSVDYLLGREKENAVVHKGTTDIATNYLKKLGLENDQKFKDFAKLYSTMTEMHRTYVLAYLIGYLNSSGINTKNIIGY